MGVIAPRRLTLRDAEPVTVRTATPEDAASILELSMQIAGEDGYTVSRPDEVDTEFSERQRELAEYAADAGKLWVVAAAGSLVVGELDIATMPRMRMRHRARLGLNVRTGWRGKGIGRAMIRAALDWAAAHPTIEKVELGVMAGNTGARRLYESLGFREEGRRGRAFCFAPGRYEDDILMAILLKDPTE